MHEKDLFKLISSSPEFNSNPEALRMLYKIWSAYTKFIRSLLSSNKTAVTLEFGKFTPGPFGCIFFPSARFMNSGNFHYNFTSPGVDCQERALNYSSISVACGYSKAECERCLKEIANFAVKNAKKEEVKLDLKVGILLLKPGEILFKGGVSNSLACSTAGVSSARTPAQSVYSTHVSNPNSINHIPVKRHCTVAPMPENIPWPYVSGFFEDSIQKTGKKINTQEILSPEKLLQEHTRQISEKKKKKKIKHVEERKDGQVLVQVANSELKMEKAQKKFYNEAVKKMFIESNKEQIEEHKELLKMKKSEIKGEKYDFFPFTYGSKLEEYQMYLKSQLNEEMKAKMSNDKAVYAKNHGIPESYLTTFPLFLKQNRANPVRRLENNHVKAVMGQALSRYEGELNKIRENKARADEQRLVQEETQKAYLEYSKNTVEKATQANKKYVLDQIENDVTL